MVAKSVLHPDGPSHGQALIGDKDGMIWGKRLTGKIKLVCLFFQLPFFNR